MSTYTCHQIRLSSDMAPACTAPTGARSLRQLHGDDGRALLVAHRRADGAAPAPPRAETNGERVPEASNRRRAGGRISSPPARACMSAAARGCRRRRACACATAQHPLPQRDGRACGTPTASMQAQPAVDHRLARGGGAHACKAPLPPPPPPPQRSSRRPPRHSAQVARRAAGSAAPGQARPRIRRASPAAAPCARALHRCACPCSLAHAQTVGAIHGQPRDAADLCPNALLARGAAAPGPAAARAAVGTARRLPDRQRARR